MASELVISQISKIVAGEIAGTAGVSISTIAMGTVVTSMESLNLYNRMNDGTATPTDVIAATVGAETILLGAGILIVGGAPILVAGIILGAAGAYVFYERNGDAAGKSLKDLYDDIKKGKSPLDAAAKALHDFKENSYKRNLSIPWIENDYYRQSRTPPRRDPLAIDLDGDGIETVGLPTAANPGQPILFDHDADGVKTGTGWLKGDDAWLVMDRNGNGVIDSGRELFGADTQITSTVKMPGGAAPITVVRNANSGFEALSSLDSNGDKVFNALDAKFTQVRLWQDTNQDGISQAGELKTLGSLGITGISLVPPPPP